MSHAMLRRLVSQIPKELVAYTCLWAFPFSS